MGLRLAAYICQRVTNAVVYVHRSFGYWSINYLDDFGSAELADQAWSSYNLMGKIMNTIGLQEAEEKSVPPNTRMEFLGNTVDTLRMTLEVSEHRKQELSEILDQSITKEKFTKKQLQSLIGKLSFVTNCIRPGRIFLNRLLAKLRECPEVRTIQADAEMRRDIAWWRKFLPQFDGISLLWLREEFPANYLLASDALLVGGGAVHKKEFFHHKFTAETLQLTSNMAQLELYTIMIVVKRWALELTGQVVRFDTDNQVSLYAVNSGATRDAFMLKCLRDIALYSAQYQFLLWLTYISSAKNELPDALSRWYQNMDARRTVRHLTDKMWTRRSIDACMLKFESMF